MVSPFFFLVLLFAASFAVLQEGLNHGLRLFWFFVPHQIDTSKWSRNLLEFAIHEPKFTRSVDPMGRFFLNHHLLPVSYSICPIGLGKTHLCWASRMSWRPGRSGWGRIGAGCDCPGPPQPVGAGATSGGARASAIGAGAWAVMLGAGAFWPYFAAHLSLCHPSPFCFEVCLARILTNKELLFSQSSLELGQSSNIAWSFSLLFLSWSFTSFAKYVPPLIRDFLTRFLGGEPNLRSCPLRARKVSQVLETRIACHWQLAPSRCKYHRVGLEKS